MTEYRFEELVPHAAPMALLDQVERSDRDSCCASLVIRDGAPFVEASGVPGWVGIEYMAQAVGAFAGIQARQSGSPVRIGFLVGSRRYRCEREYFAVGEKLLVSVKQEIAGENGLSVFACAISDDNGNILAEANLNVFQPDDPESFLAGESTP